MKEMTSFLMENLHDWLHGNRHSKRKSQNISLGSKQVFILPSCSGCKPCNCFSFVLLALFGLLAFSRLSPSSVCLTSGWACCKYLFPFSFNIVAFLPGGFAPRFSVQKKRIQIGQLPSRFVLFSFGPTCMLFDLLIALRLCHDLSKVTAPTHHFGACETWVSLGPHRPGSRPSPTSGSSSPEDPPTCQ
jgi:hypothetical protein